MAVATVAKAPGKQQKLQQSSKRSSKAVKAEAKQQQCIKSNSKAAKAPES